MVIDLSIRKPLSSFLSTFVSLVGWFPLEYDPDWVV